MKVIISSGHGLHVRGASGILDEVDEARLVVEQIAEDLRAYGVEAVTYHDDVSTTQNENLNRIVDFHNSKTRDLDVSVHFNAYQPTPGPMGTETLHLTQEQLAINVSKAIASCGFINRGAKERTDLFFLNNTSEPAILIETCFVDSESDAKIYEANFDKICRSIAVALAATEISRPEAMVHLIGSCSHFGGPNDMGVDPDEGLAFIQEIDEAPHLFLPRQPVGTTGLARRLNPYVHYIACRWDYNKTPKLMLLDQDNLALIHAIKTGITLTAFPADWGPHADTGRVADISPGLMRDLNITTDDDVEVVYPYREDEV